MTTILSSLDPVTFDGDDDRVGLVHRYAGRDDTRTACDVPLAPDHGVVSSASTKPLCTDCWA